MKKRALSLLMVLVMVLSSVELSAFAAEAEPENDASVVQLTQEEQISEKGSEDGQPAEKDEKEILSDDAAADETVSEDGSSPEQAAVQEGSEETFEEPEFSENDSAEPEVAEPQKETVKEIEEPYSEPQEIPAEGDGTVVTRIEWLKAVIEAFSMTAEAELYPDNYYSDITESSEDYASVMIATRYGLIDVEAGDPFNPNDPATREFAVHTLNLCLGFVKQSEEYTFEESGSVTYPDDIQAAVDLGWFTLADGKFNPDSSLTASEKTSLINFAKTAIASTKIEDGHSNTYEFADGVKVLNGVTAEMLDDEKYVLKNCTTSLSVGDKFGVVISGIPIVKSVKSIEESDGALIVATESVAMEDAFKSLDVQGSSEIDLSTVRSSSDSAKICYIVGGTLENEWKDGQKSDDLEDVDPASISAVEIAQSFDIPTSIKGKYGLPDDVKADIVCTASDISKDYNVSIRERSAFVKLYATITFNCNVDMDIMQAAAGSSAFTLLTVPLGIGNMDVVLDLSMKGSVQATVVERVTMGVSFDKNSGFRLIRSLSEQCFSVSGSAEATAGIKATLGFDVGAMKGSVYAKMGANVAVTMKKYEDKPYTCTQIDSYLYASAGCNASVDFSPFYKNSWSHTINIFNKMNSPARVVFHYEDGDPVEKCTRAGSSYKYFSPTFSRFGFNGKNSGTYPNGQEYKVFDYSEPDDKGNITLTHYYGRFGSLNIPEKIDGYTVVGLGERLFEKDTVLRMVIIPDTVTTIGYNAFTGCVNMVDIHLPKSLTSIQEGTFYECTSLEHINIPKGLTSISTGNNGGLFGKCKNLKRITFEEGITTIIPRLFYLCPGPVQIEIPDTVTKIGTYAFNGCENLEKVIIPEYVTEIDNGAFSGCVKLSDVQLPASLTILEQGAFWGCTSLTKINIPKSLKTTATGNNGGVFGKCDNLKEVIFEEGITNIVADLFYCCPGLEEIAIPDTVTRIEGSAFGSCENLKKVEMSDNVTRIDGSAFSNCPKLAEIKLPKYLQQIAKGSFHGCTSLTKINIPKSLSTVTTGNNGGIFAKCDNLKEIIFEEGITSIVADLFIYCNGIEEIVIPDTVTEIGSCAFKECENLKKVTIPEGVTSIKSNAFDGCKALKSVTVPESATSLENAIFKGCSGLEEAKLLPKRKSIPGYMFYDCTSLKKVEYPETVTTIKEYAFRNAGLTELILPDNVEKLESCAFGDCASLTKVTAGEKLTEISSKAFINCKLLNTVTLKTGLKTIGSEAFKNCDALADITIPNSVTSIGSRIFESCEVLKDVQLSNNLTEIPSYAFYECPKLESIVIPYKVAEIGDYAFALCTALKEITIPRSVKKIGNNVFSYPGKITIYGISGTYAEEYANGKSIKFINREVSITGLSFDKTEVILTKGASAFLVLSVEPIDFTDTIKWDSSDTEVATVENGQVKAVGLGTAKITALAGDTGEINAVCNVEVVQPVTKITLNKTTLSLEGGEVFELTAAVEPADAYNKEVIWTSSDETVATVSEEGLVTAIKKGKATVKAEAKDGSGATASCEVTVNSTVTVARSIEELQSAHPYENNSNAIWLYSLEGAKFLNITFSEKTALDEGHDYLYIYDGSGKEIGKYTGTELANKTIKVNGDTVKIRLVSDESTNAYGFEVTEVTTTDPSGGNDDDNNDDNNDDYEDEENDQYSVYDNKQRIRIDRCDISDIRSKVYNGKPYKPTPKVTLYTSDGDKLLKEGVDYRLSYTETVNAGRHKVIIRGIGNYIGKAEAWFEIERKSLGKLTYVVEQIAVGDLGATPITVYDGDTLLEMGKDYTYTLKDYHVNSPGKSSITVWSVKDSNYEDYKDIDVTVIDTEGKGVTLIRSDDITVNDSNLYYTGKALKPSVEVKVNGTVLTSADYKLQYKKNKNVGTGYVIVTAKTGKGKLYAGKAIKTFKIVQKHESLDVTVNDATYLGKLLKPTVTVRNPDGKKLKANKDYRLEYSNNFNAGTGYVTVTGIGNYTGLKQELKPFTISPQKIKKATFKAGKNYGIRGTYNKRPLTYGVDYIAEYYDTTSNGKKVKITIKPGSGGNFKEECNKTISKDAWSAFLESIKESD